MKKLRDLKLLILFFVSNATNKLEQVL